MTTRVIARRVAVERSYAMLHGILASAFLALLFVALLGVSSGRMSLAGKEAKKETNDKKPEAKKGDEKTVGRTEPEPVAVPLEGVIFLFGSVTLNAILVVHRLARARLIEDAPTIRMSLTKIILDLKADIEAGVAANVPDKDLNGKRALLAGTQMELTALEGDVKRILKTDQETLATSLPSLVSETVKSLLEGKKEGGD